MKKILILCLLLAVALCAFTACEVPGGGGAPVCQHRDADDNNLCDKCSVAHADGKDILDEPCQHRDADDDDLCDECAEPYSDGKDLPDEQMHGDLDKDHNCDCGCGFAYGMHADYDNDHACDYGCASSIGTHDDLDKNHVCDYGCGNSIGECADADKNHACDYGCAKTFGMHLDEDCDHICDYGCELSFGEHADANKDHVCDYGCKTSIGVHAPNGIDGSCNYCQKIVEHACEDADGNHLCDICQKLLTMCADDNRDHACDLCGKILSECIDSEKDHKCDYGCGKIFGEHADNDKNGLCDYCVGTITHVCVDEDKNHWCDYGCDYPYFGNCADYDRDFYCDYGCGRHFCWDEDYDCYCDAGCGEHFYWDEAYDHFCDCGCGEMRGMEEHFPSEERHFCHYCGEHFIDFCYDIDPIDHTCDFCGFIISECVDASPADHVCDICNWWLGDCFDDDLDHVCDICNWWLGGCFDDDLDHFCDVCGNRISDCTDDENCDHICDICNWWLGGCFDDDLDHFCDVCGNRISDCTDDENCDHICDICGKILSECLDEYPCDHACDICGKILSECIDTDFDHKCDSFCDNYGKFYESHVDENKDHICDTYGEKCLQTKGTFDLCEDADGDGYCDYGCGKQFEIESDAPLYTRDGDYIYFGEYPQTVKADDVTITDKQDSRGYFLGSDGCYYVMVTANLAGHSYTFSNGESVVFEEVYYFKVEPIRWRILSIENGVAFILCENIIANMVFDAYTGAESNNYKDSDVRAWLNAQFYENAFSALQKDLILTTLVDNSLASTGYNSNPYTCEDTEDKIFLLSYADMTNSAYGFNIVSYAADAARKKLTTDYVRASGGWMSIESNYYGYGKWWLRTPYYNYKRLARCILQNGEIFDDNYIYSSNYGVVPALRIVISSHGEHLDNNYDHYCDECAIEMNVHSDSDFDHSCDVYGVNCAHGNMGECKDSDKDGDCDYGCGKTFENGTAPLYVRDGDYIYFGEYPQTVKANDVTITETQDSRGYYLGSDGCYYAKIIANPAMSSGYKFSTGATVAKYTTYYFKVEPIRWRILSENEGKALILCDSIIANTAYQSDYFLSGTNWYTTANGAPENTYANNYQYSAVRAWLNVQFYECAFNDLQKALIQATLVDNSAESTDSASNLYACEDTLDKIFLLSYAEATNSAYGMDTDESRCMTISDYGRATGVYMATNSVDYGNGYWWLRSPKSGACNQASAIYYNGDTDKIEPVNSITHGVVPALWICL